MLCVLSFSSGFADTTEGGFCPIYPLEQSNFQLLPEIKQAIENAIEREARAICGSEKFIDFSASFDSYGNSITIVICEERKKQ